MAVATVVTDSATNLITSCDSVTEGGTWAGVSLDPITSDPSPLQGTASLGGIFKSTTDLSNDAIFTPTTPLNLTNQHLRWQLFTILGAVLKTFAEHSIDIYLSDGTNTAQYTVSGSDVYIGRWETLVLDVNSTPWLGTAPNMAAITAITIIFRLNVAAKNFDTAFFDYITFGNGFQAIYGGTSGDEITFVEIAAQDVFYKIFELIGGVYRGRGELIFGDNIGTNSTYFKHPGGKLIFDDLVVSDSLYKVKAVGNTTGISIIDFSGILFSAVGARFLFDSTDINAICLLTGTNIQKANYVNLGPTTTANGTVIDDCYAVDPGGAVLSGVTIKNTAEVITGSLLINSQTEAELCTNVNFQGYSMNGRYAVYVAASVTTFSMDGWIFDDPNNTTGIALHWLGTTGTLTINASNGTNLVDAGCSAEIGGSVEVLSLNSITVVVRDEATKVLLPDARVHVIAGATGPLAEGTVIINAELTGADGTVVGLFNGVDQSFIGLVSEASDPGLYVAKPISGIIGTGGATIDVGLVKDE